jgi:DNA-binding transcriptional MerR regulator
MRSRPIESGNNGTGLVMLDDLMRQIRNHLFRIKEGGAVPEVGRLPQHQRQLGEQKTILSSHLLEKVQELARAHDTFSSGSASLSTSWSKASFNRLKVRLVKFFGSSQVRWNADTARVIGMLLNALDRVDDSLSVIRQQLEAVEQKSAELAQRSDRPAVEQGQKDAERQSTELAQRLKLVETYSRDMEHRLKRLEQVQQETAKVLESQAEKFLDPNSEDHPA